MTTQYLTYPICEGIPKVDRVFAIGFFDGVHKGHQHVMYRTIALAEKMKCIPSILTFYPHPREVIKPGNTHKGYITPLAEKISQFYSHQIDTVYVMQFTPEFAQISKERFITEVLSVLSAKGVVTGFNFTFGQGAKGDTEDLRRLGKGNFEVDIVEAVQKDAYPISSTRLRNALANGSIEEVTYILGRPYVLEGRVILGDQKGREIGFPTANLCLLQSFLIPRHGVYVVRVGMAGGICVEGIMNIGIRPTVAKTTPEERLEVHLFCWNQDLYGKVLRVELLHYIREEKKFSSLSDLTHQIQQDVVMAKDWFRKKEASRVVNVL